MTTDEIIDKYIPQNLRERLRVLSLGEIKRAKIAVQDELKDENLTQPKVDVAQVFLQVINHIEFDKEAAGEVVLDPAAELRELFQKKVREAQGRSR